MWSVLLSTMSTRHTSFPKQFLRIVSACWASLQTFLKGKIWRVQVAHMHNEAHALSSPSPAVFSIVNKSWQRFLSLSLILWYCGKKQIKCGLTWHYWWLGSTDLGLINWHVFEYSECSSSKYGFFPDLGEKNGGLLSMRMQVILDSSFAPPPFPTGFSPYKGREESRVQGLDYV